MLKNYLVIAWRSLLKNKLSSFVNIAGLTIGMAVSIMIGLWIWDEVTFNSTFKNHKNLAQVMLNQTENGETSTDETIAMPVADALRSNHSDKFHHVALVSFSGDHVISAGTKKFSRSGRWVEAEFTKMFTPALLEGNADALSDPSSVLVSSSTAHALYGNETAVGKTIRLDNKQDMKVAGVYKDFPHNTLFFETALLLPWQNKENYNWTKSMTNWDNHSGLAFVELKQGLTTSAVTEKIKGVPTPHIENWKEELLLHPLDKQHLYTEFVNGKAAGGRIGVVKLIGLIGGFVLLLACINFMNLSTARSEKRAKEVGIRKAVGSLRRQLIVQFLSESVLTAFLAMLIAIELVHLTLPTFNEIAEKQITIAWSNPLGWLLVVAFTLITGLIAGSYPAFFLSAFEPVKVLKGLLKSGRLASLPRKVLVVTQFSFSIALVIGTMVVFRQIEFSRAREVGYQRADLLTVPLNPELWGRFRVLKNELLQTGVVTQVAESSYSPAYISNNNSVEWREKDPSSTIFFRDVNVTHDFGKTIGWHVVEGRDFSEDYLTDSAAAIVNETGAKTMGFTAVIGEKVKYAGKEYTIVGVVKDMLTQSPYEAMPPSIFFCSGWMGVVDIRLKAGTTDKEALSKIESIFKKLSPGYPFDYSFVDERYNRKFANEQRIGRLAALFAGLAILISCMGLFGLASFLAENKGKEIALRKVLGASVFVLWQQLSKEFVVLVLLSQIIAVPVAWYFMNNWLADFYYRSTLTWWIFAVACVGALFITLATVSFQALKTAISNPLNKLRTE